MGALDPRVDAYIEKSAPFAQPILKHLRNLVHEACPEVQENIKWSFPVFEYKGIMCNMASFKEHCAFGFWKTSLMEDPHQLFDKDAAMGSLGKLTSLADLPADDILKAYIQQAKALNDKNVKRPAKPKPTADTPLAVPDYLTSALADNANARGVFDKASYSYRKEYIDWLQEAKTDATRQKRLDTALEWIAEGKGRNWKYEKK